MKKTLLFIIIILVFLMSFPIFALTGDANSDGRIDIVDALLAAKYYVKLNPPGVNPSVMDVSGDGKITIVDALLIAKFYVKAISVFPVDQNKKTPKPTETPKPKDTPGKSTNAEAEVKRSGNTWQANGPNGRVYSGSDMIAAINAAIKSLSSGRRSKQTVAILSSGDTGSYKYNKDIKAIHLQSYTVLDFRGNTINVNDRDGEDDIVPVSGRNVKEIEIKNLTIKGNPRYGIWLQSCSAVKLSNIKVSIGSAKTIGLGIRIDDKKGSRSKNINATNIFVENAKHHGFETYGVDDIRINSIETKNTGGCGLILNDTSNAKVGTVKAYRANKGGGYAGFRVARNAGPNIQVDKVTAVECGRGVFSVSGSHGVTINKVEISGSTSHGVLLEDTQNFMIKGGTIKNCSAEGVRIASRSSNQYKPSQNNTLQNLNISGCSYGIRETSSGGTKKNKINNNTLKGNKNCISLEVSKSSSKGNKCN